MTKAWQPELPCGGHTACHGTHNHTDTSHRYVTQIRTHLQVFKEDYKLCVNAVTGTYLELGGEVGRGVCVRHFNGWGD